MLWATEGSRGRHCVHFWEIRITCLLTGCSQVHSAFVAKQFKSWGKNGMERMGWKGGIKRARTERGEKNLKKSEEERLHLKKYLVNTMRWCEPGIEMTEWARSPFNQLWKEMPCLEWMGLLHPVGPLQNPVSRCQRDPQCFKYPGS